MRHIGSLLAGYLNRSRPKSTPAGPAGPTPMRRDLEPGDVLLVEGRSQISTAIKYLTQSSWSHAALYVGDLGVGRLADDSHCFVEADLVDGVRSVGLSEFAGLNTRICRPVGLDDGDRRALSDFVIARLGQHYDLKNIVDLARWLLPTPPVPTRFRRRMIALGSGDPTRAICSTLIAQAFQSIRYPILPQIERLPQASEECPDCYDEILHIRHHSLFAPRDFDVSPWFAVIKPAVRNGFDFRRLQWGDGRDGAAAALQAWA